MAASYPRYLATKYANDDCMPVRQYVMTDLPWVAPALRNCCRSSSDWQQPRVCVGANQLFPIETLRACYVSCLGNSFGLHGAVVFRNRPRVEEHEIRWRPC